MTADAAVQPSSVDTGRVNPYVGPRSLGRDDGIYGRDREIRELRSSVVAHRIVLLYSQSGAGKTSLVEAGLRPELEELEFQVFPTIRVGYDPPPSGEGARANRYRLSVLSSLEESRPPEEQLDPSELATIGLDEYFRRLDDSDPDRDPCLVFDQFEEVFTLDPTDWDEKEAFLREVGEALANRGRWALFSMREDFIAQLDPYLALFPNQLITRYRIELLDPTAAKQAIRRPAAALGVDFTEEAAEHLVDDLRRVQVQRGTESTLDLGPTVEPVQLQVVCNRLWANLPADAPTIGADDVTTAGSVNEALADFYVAQVESAASSRGVSEHEIRDWFERELMTPDGFRTQTRNGPGRSGDTVLRELQAGHLVRSDRIRGAEWYELSHDRFIEPIRASNADFRAKQRRRRRRRLSMAAGAAASVLALLAIVFYFSANAARRETAAASEQISRANERADIVEQALASQQEALVPDNQALALGVAAEAHARSGAPGTEGTVIETKTALRSSGLVMNLTGHTGPIFGVAVSSDGTRIATAGEDGTAKLWDAETGDELLTLTGHTGPVAGVAFNDDGTQIATASDDTTAKVWDAATDEELLTLTGHTGSVFGVAFNDDGTQIATASLDGTAKVWNPNTGDELLTLTGHVGEVFGVAFNDDGTQIATASLDGTAKVWNPNTGDELLTLAAGPVFGVAFNDDGTQIATASLDGTAKVWDAATGEELETLTGHAGPVSGVSFNHDGTRVTTVGFDGTAKVWDPGSSAELITLAGHTGQVWAVAFNHDGTRIATAGNDATAKVWDPETGVELATLSGHAGALNGVAFNHEGTRIATTSTDSTAKVWSADSGAELLTLIGHTEFVRGVAFSPDGTRIVTTSDDKTANVWNAETGELLRTDTGHRGPVLGVVWSSDGTRIATASNDATAKVWDAETGTDLVTLTGHVGAVWMVAFNGDGTRIATASEDGTAKLWDAATGEELLTLTGHTGPVWKVAWSPDGTRIATVGEDGTAKLWDAGTGTELLVIAGHDGSVEGVAFNADGTLLGTASVDGTAKLWDVGADDACTLVGLLVTTAELRDALGGSEPIACIDLRP